MLINPGSERYKVVLDLGEVKGLDSHAHMGIFEQKLNTQIK